MSKKQRGHAKGIFLTLLGDRPVAYHPMIAHVLGDVKQALFICQLFYWHDKGKLSDGWIWKTQDDWTEETGLSRYEQQTARKHLVEKGVLQEKLKGIPATLHYRLDLDRLFELVENWYTEKQDSKVAANLIAETPQTSSQGSHILSQRLPEITKKLPTTSQKPEKPDQWDLARKTKAVQDKARLPITYLSETVADLLGLAKVPNYQYEQRWEEPLRDLLDQADGDIDRVEVALRAAALEGHGNGMTMTTASSLHGLALKALAQTNGKDTTEDVEAREAAARAKMHELAREHGHE